MSVMRVGSRTPATSKAKIFVTIVKKWKLSKIATICMLLFFTCYSGPRSRLSQLIIDIVDSCDDQGTAQSGLNCIIQMLQKKMKNNYKELKTSFIVCTLIIQ